VAFEGFGIARARAAGASGRLTGPVALIGTALLALSVALTGPVGSAAAEGLHRAEVDPVTAGRIRATQRWQAVAAAFDAAGGTADPLFAAADAASALAARVNADGWAAPQIPGLVAALLATANPDGGFGLTRAWDAFQDGSVNPPDTTYTATTVGHVGPVLLSGFAAGVIPRAAVQHAVDAILDLPRSHGDRCIPYSSSAADQAAPCVWNVHFGAADWLVHATQLLNYRTQDAASLAAATTSWLTVLPQNPVTGYWPYSSAGGGPQDIGHQLWTAAAVDDLRGGHDAVALMIRGPLWRQQARTFHDYNVASAMSGIALLDCRYATDATVLRYAGSTDRGTPYVFKALAGAALRVVRTCLTPGVLSARSTTPAPAELPHDLG
jgi:hypothetical protein